MRKAGQELLSRLQRLPRSAHAEGAAGHNWGAFTLRRAANSAAAEAAACRRYFTSYSHSPCFSECRWPPHLPF